MKAENVLSLSINCFKNNQALFEIENALKNNRKTRVATINNEICNIAFDKQDYTDIINSFELRVVDSTGVAWALRRRGVETEIIKGVDLAIKICAIAEKLSKSIFLLGGARSVGKKSADELLKQFPKLRIAGYLDGIEVDSGYNADLAQKINASHADIVFVCLGAPKQEIWIQSNYQKVDSLIFVGLGGTLDFISKTIPRAPRFMRNIGLEWFFRFITQPSRYKRIFSALVVFPLRILVNSKR